MRKFTKMFPLFLSLLLVFLPMTSFSVSANPNQAFFLNITRQEQYQTKWCWAACSSMISQYLSPTSFRSQYEIVGQIKGSMYVNDGATDSEVINAMNYALHYKYSAKSTGPQNFAFVQDKIASNKPPIISIGWNAGGAHVVVASGYNSLTSNIRVIDPWYGCGTSQYSYAAMVNGTTFESGVGKVRVVFYY